MPVYEHVQDAVVMYVLTHTCPDTYPFFLYSLFCFLVVGADGCKNSSKSPAQARRPWESRETSFSLKDYLHISRQR